MQGVRETSRIYCQALSYKLIVAVQNMQLKLWAS